MKPRSQFDRRGTDPLYKATSPQPSTVNTVVLGYLLTALLLVLALPLWLAMTSFVRATNNWFDGNGFTPFTPTQEFSPASWTHASVTWVQPPEVAQP